MNLNNRYKFVLLTLTADMQDFNLWNQVDDFGWLKSEQSPSWSVLEVDDPRAINETDLSNMTTGQSSDWTLKHTLQAVNISIDDDDGSKEQESRE